MGIPAQNLTKVRVAIRILFVTLAVPAIAAALPITLIHLFFILQLILRSHTRALIHELVVELSEELHRLEDIPIEILQRRQIRQLLRRL